MTPLQIKLAIYAAITLLVIGAYFSWEHHIKSIQHEKDRAEVALRDADTARQSAELIATEKANVEKLNNEQTARLQNAITIYATRTTDLNRDVDNLTNRLRNNRTSASCSQNAVPGASDDNGQGKGGDYAEDKRIASAAVELANLCEMQINRFPVAN